MDSLYIINYKDNLIYNILNPNTTLKNNVHFLDVIDLLGFKNPVFCYSSMLNIAGNCRMCLLEVTKKIKPLVGCASFFEKTTTLNPISITTKTAQEIILEYILLNHPKDCPVCDQGGECDLQNNTFAFGSDLSRFFLNKRAVKSIKFFILIDSFLNKCILCTRCVRSDQSYIRSFLLGVMGRGVHSQISYYKKHNFNNANNYSINIALICPVGVLKSKKNFNLSV